MSTSPSGDDTREESAPVLTPLTAHPLARLTFPALAAVAIVGGVIYGLRPVYTEADDASQKWEKMRQQDVEHFSRSPELKYRSR